MLDISVQQGSISTDSQQSLQVGGGAAGVAERTAALTTGL